MGDNPLLSIIVPVYNVEHYIASCLDSLLRQEYQNIEIILVDDGSKDNSYELCRVYADRDTRIKLYQQENQGLSVTRNNGLKSATGELVTFLDSDDEVLPETYSEAIKKLLSQAKCDQVQFPLFKEVGTDRSYRVDNNYAPIYNSEAMLSNWVIDRHISWIVCNKIYRVELIRQLSFIPGIYFEDNIYISQMLKLSKGVCFSDVGGYLYYTRPGSITNTHTARHYLDMIRAHIMIHQELGQAEGLASARGHMAYMIACDVFANPRWYRKETPIAVEGLRYLRGTSINDIVFARGLHSRRKMKALGIKFFADLFG